MKQQRKYRKYILLVKKKSKRMSYTKKINQSVKGNGYLGLKKSFIDTLKWNDVEDLYLYFYKDGKIKISSIKKLDSNVSDFYYLKLRKYINGQWDNYRIQLTEGIIKKLSSIISLSIEDDSLIIQRFI